MCSQVQFQGSLEKFLTSSVTWRLYMCYGLPFPDILRMEKLHATAKVIADAVTFLSEMQIDLDRSNPNAMGDLRERRLRLLYNEMKVAPNGRGLR